MTAWFIYIIRCADGSRYTGITTDVSRRFAEHARSGPRAARYLRGRGPLTLVFWAPAGSRSAALSLERRIKSLPRKHKLALSQGRFSLPAE